MKLHISGLVFAVSALQIHAQGKVRYFNEMGKGFCLDEHEKPYQFYGIECVPDADSDNADDLAEKCGLECHREGLVGIELESLKFSSSTKHRVYCLYEHGTYEGELDECPEKNCEGQGQIFSSDGSVEWVTCFRAQVEKMGPGRCVDEYDQEYQYHSIVCEHTAEDCLYGCQTLIKDGHKVVGIELVTMATPYFANKLGYCLYEHGHFSNLEGEGKGKGEIVSSDGLVREIGYQRETFECFKNLNFLSAGTFD